MIINNQQKTRGFTLIELMITVAIVAILASIAIPSYLSQITQSRRADATDALLDCAAAQARWFTTESPSTYLNQNDAIAANICNPGGGNLNSREGHYQLRITNPNNCTTNGSLWCFLITATPTPGTSQANDDLCQTMTIDHRGRRAATGNLGGVASDTTDNCWRT